VVEEKKDDEVKIKPNDNKEDVWGGFIMDLSNNNSSASALPAQPPPPPSYPPPQPLHRVIVRDTSTTMQQMDSDLLDGVPPAMCSWYREECKRLLAQYHHTARLAPPSVAAAVESARLGTRVLAEIAQLTDAYGTLENFCGRIKTKSLLERSLFLRSPDTNIIFMVRRPTKAVGGYAGPSLQHKSDVLRVAADHQPAGIVYINATQSYLPIGQDTEVRPDMARIKEALELSVKAFAAPSRVVCLYKRPSVIVRVAYICDTCAPDGTPKSLGMSMGREAPDSHFIDVVFLAA
jgi:hypothetical protein